MCCLNINLLFQRTYNKSPNLAFTTYFLGKTSNHTYIYIWVNETGKHKRIYAKDEDTFTLLIPANSLDSLIVWLNNVNNTSLHPRQAQASGKWSYWSVPQQKDQGAEDDVLDVFHLWTLFSAVLVCGPPWQPEDFSFIVHWRCGFGGRCWLPFPMASGEDGRQKAASNQTLVFWFSCPAETWWWRPQRHGKLVRTTQPPSHGKQHEELNDQPGVSPAWGGGVGPIKGTFWVSVSCWAAVLWFPALPWAEDTVEMSRLQGQPGLLYTGFPGLQDKDNN